MAVIHWAVLDMNGDLIGQHSQLFVSSNLKKYNDFIPPAGYMKVLISNQDFLSLGDSFDYGNKIYNKHIDPIESKTRDLPEARKIKNKAKANPPYFRIYTDGTTATKDKDGKIVFHPSRSK